MINAGDVIKVALKRNTVFGRSNKRKCLTPTNGKCDLPLFHPLSDFFRFGADGALFTADRTMAGVVIRSLPQYPSECRLYHTFENRTKVKGKLLMVSLFPMLIAIGNGIHQCQQRFLVR